MKPSRFFFMLMLVGVVVPWHFLLCFLFTEDFSVMNFILSMFANPVASSIAADLMISAMISFYFMNIEGARIGMGKTWKYMFASLMVGLSFGLPWFLYDRAKLLEARTCI